MHSEQELWGIPRVTQAEREQLDSRNALLRARLTVLHIATISETAAIMEHPALAHRIPGAASSWKLSYFHFLRSLEECVSITVHPAKKKR